MRTLILTLTVLLFAAPVWATVTVTAVVDAEAKTVTIGYESDEGMVRAFALDIAATGGNITAISGYTPGDDTGGYGIFPGSFDDVIVVDPCGVVSNWGDAGYTPVAPADDTGALGAIPGPGITIEMGSLYPDGGNAPPETAGDLCTITVDGDVTEVCITANAIRGNVVLEDANEPDTLVVPGCVPTTGGCNFPSSNSTYDNWVDLGKPECWCNPYQCDGDGDNATQTIFKYRIYTADLDFLIADWKKKIGSDLDPCGDYDHKSQTIFKYQIYTGDLQKLIDNWKKKDINLPGDCPRAE